jgi:hypothetical protein
LKRRFLATDKLAEIANKIVDNTVEYMIKNEIGKQFIPFRYIESIFIRVLSQVIFGEIMEWNDPRIDQIKNSFDLIQVNSLKVFIVEYFPVLKLIISPFKNKQIGIRTTKLFYEWFSKRKLIVNQTGRFDCFTDLSILLRNNLNEGNENEFLDDKQLFGDMIALYFGKTFNRYLRVIFFKLLYITLKLASSDTVFNTFKWMVLLMSYYPEIQTKMRLEISKTIGRNNLILYVN